MAKLSTHLQELEAESISILREVAGRFDRPVLLFSGGKDSITLVHLARKAFAPGLLPFPLLHVDTGHNFPEVIAFRDKLAADIQAQLLVRTVDDAIAKGLAKPVPGEISRNFLQIPTLLGALKEFKFDAAIGGARRDEEKARAKERIFSHRDEFGTWNPKNQRPELWNLYNTLLQKGEQMRVFPISNWTEADIWEYIDQENIQLPSLYFSHQREVIARDGQWIAHFPQFPLQAGETPVVKTVRFRTVGDIVCTGAVESTASNTQDVIAELIQSETTERGTRTDDQRSWAAMEDRKKLGYF
ncbi:MAG: sulfate adenylyltransferase subunit CysD [Pseudobdellovibrionaceae bacterium]